MQVPSSFVGNISLFTSLFLLFFFLCPSSGVCVCFFSLWILDAASFVPLHHVFCPSSIIGTMSFSCVAPFRVIRGFVPFVFSLS